METGILYAIIAGIFWGTSPVLVKRGLANSDVSAATLIQQAAIFLTLILFALWESSGAAGQVSTAAMLVFVSIGVVGAYLGRTLFVKSVDQIGASRAQIVNNTSPLVTVLLAALLLDERLTATVLAGVILIVSGIFFIPRAAEPQSNPAAQRRIVTSTAVFATICYGLVPVMKKFATDSGGSPMLGALTIHATGLLLLLTLGSLLKIELKWQRVPLPSFLCFVFAGVLQAIGSVFTLKALLYAPASVVAPIWNTQPIISFFLARFALKGIEVVTFRDGIAAALVVMGVLVMRWA